MSPEYKNIPPCLLKSRLLPRLRHFFQQRDIHEAHTDLLVKSTAIEPFIEPVKSGDRFLPTSPEFALKKLLALQPGLRGLYEVCKVARGDQRSRLHSRSFTMVEWYRRNHRYRDLAIDVQGLAECLSGEEHSLVVMSLAELVEKELKVSISPGSDATAWCSLADMAKPGSDPVEELATMIEAYSLVYDRYLQPALQKAGGLVAVFDFPWFARGMARLNGQGWAERIEVFGRGIELANGYQELDDSEELRSTWVLNNQVRASMGKEEHPIDEQLLHLTPAMKNVAGIAVGYERLLMVLFRIEDIADFDLQ